MSLERVRACVRASRLPPVPSEPAAVVSARRVDDPRAVTPRVSVDGDKRRVTPNTAAIASSEALAQRPDARRSIEDRPAEVDLSRGGTQW